MLSCKLFAGGSTSGSTRGGFASGEGSALGGKIVRRRRKKCKMALLRNGKFGDLFKKLSLFFKGFLSVGLRKGLFCNSAKISTKNTKSRKNFDFCTLQFSIYNVVSTKELHPSHCGNFEDR